MNRHRQFFLILIIVFAFIMRVYNFSFPFFTVDEARVAFRGYTLATLGRDELGRSFPILFNSLSDYQLPVVSYLTAGGIFLFGKNDFGARSPFIILGVALVYLVYQISRLFNNQPRVWLLAAVMTAFSPALIFLSKIPNEFIVLGFLLTLLFYLLVKPTTHLVAVFPVSIIAILTSKFAWFILGPFVLITLIFYSNISKKRKWFIIACSFFISILAFGIFSTVPQAKRSLAENNFSLFSDITIQNGINQLRGQGIEMGWPNFLEKILFNKSVFLSVGFLHWFSNLQPALYFGQFDAKGTLGFSVSGTWAKSLIIPFFLGLVFLIRESNKRQKLLILYPLILTFPAMFIYPHYSLGLLILTLPFMALIISLGFTKISRTVTLLILGLMVVEVGINLLYLVPDIKNTNNLRPSWIKPIVEDIYQKSQKTKIAASDNIVEDIIPFIKWQTAFDPENGFEAVPSPYKFRQSKLKNIILHGFDDNRNLCEKKDRMDLFLSSRDLKLIEEQADLTKMKFYHDNLDQNAAYFLSSKLCLN